MAGVAALGGTALGAFDSPLRASSGWLGWAALLGTAFVLANVCLQYGAARLAASTTSVIMLSEVLFASVSSVALGAAAMEPRILVGGSLIVLGAVWAAFARTPVQRDDRASSSPT